jgi:hypothetical protein
MAEAQDANLLPGYIRAWAFIVVTGAFALGITFIVLGTLHNIPAAARSILQAVGTSVIASLILYVLVSLLIDPKRQLAQARQAMMYGVQLANRQFAERFEVALPTEVYESSTIPKPAFRNAFVELMCSSTRYDFRGDSASFTTYRLARCSDHPEIRRLDQVRLCVLDPLAPRATRIYAEQYLRQHGQSYDSAKTVAKERNLREEIYVSLWTLYRIRHRVTASVYFHSDLPFFRCELFDNGMFLTYYLDRTIYPNYPETLQFSSATRPYRAYSTAMAITRTYAPKVTVFGDVGPGADLVNDNEKFLELLTSLGCELTFAQLDKLQAARFQKFDRLLGEAGMAVTELF